MALQRENKELRTQLLTRGSLKVSGNAVRPSLGQVGALRGMAILSFRTCGGARPPAFTNVF